MNTFLSRPNPKSRMSLSAEWTDSLKASALSIVLPRSKTPLLARTDEP